jgi:hypothetical protein
MYTFYKKTVIISSKDFIIFFAWSQITCPHISLQMVGHVLIHTPPGPDGLCIHHSVANVLNAKDAKDMREGFHIELWNSRGVSRGFLILRIPSFWP